MMGEAYRPKCILRHIDAADLSLTFQEESFTEKSHFLWLGIVKPFHATSLFLFPLKTSEKHMYPDVFRGFRKTPVV